MSACLLNVTNRQLLYEFSRNFVSGSLLKFVEKFIIWLKLGDSDAPSTWRGAWAQVQSHIRNLSIAFACLWTRQKDQSLAFNVRINSLVVSFIVRGLALAQKHTITRTNEATHSICSCMNVLWISVALEMMANEQFKETEQSRDMNYQEGNYGRRMYLCFWATSS